MASKLRVFAGAESSVDDMSDITAGGGSYVTRSTAQTVGAHSLASFLFADGGASFNYRVKDSAITGRYGKLVFAFRLKTRPSSGEYGSIIFVGNSSWVTTFGLYHDENGNLELVDTSAGGANQGTSPSTYALDTWYWCVIEEDYVIATNHDITIRTYDANGTAIENWSDDGSMSDIGSMSGFGMGVGLSGAAYYGGGSEVYVDDIALWVDSSALTVPIRSFVLNVEPDSDGTDHALWTAKSAGAHYLEVYEAPLDAIPTHDADGSYISTTTPSHGDDVKRTCGIAGGTTVYGIEGQAYCKVTSGIFFFRQQFHVDSTVGVASGNFLLTTAYVFNRFYRAQDPSSTDWTPTTIDAINHEAYDFTDNTTGYCTWLQVAVCYDGGVVTPSTFTPRVMIY